MTGWGWRAEELIEPPGQHRRRSRDLDYPVPAGRAGHQRDIRSCHAERARHGPQCGQRPRRAWRWRGRL